MSDSFATTSSPSATLPASGTLFEGGFYGSPVRRCDCRALEIRSVTRTDQDRFEAAMTMAFSADPVARWAWPDPLQFINIFIPLVTLFGGKSFDHGSAYVIGDFSGVAQWLPPGVQPDDGPIGDLFKQNMSEPKLGEVLFLFEQMAGFHPMNPTGTFL